MKRFWILVVTVLTLVLMLVTTVYASENEFTVTISGNAYCGGEYAKPEPVVTCGGVTLKKDTDYYLSYKNTDSVGVASVTVTGQRNYAGITKTVSYKIFRNDIANADCLLSSATFTGTGAVTPSVDLYIDGEKLVSGRDYVYYFENNYNFGTAYVHFVGIGNYYGSNIVPFTIKGGFNNITLESNYVGQADSQIDPSKTYYEEMIISPGGFRGKINSTFSHYVRSHVAYYELYKIVGEEAVLVTSYQSPYGDGLTTAFEYNFSSVYEDDAAEGGAVYLLSYAWVDNYMNVYAGTYALIIPAKIPDATSMVMEHLPDINDPFQEHFTVYGPDGNIGRATWSVSDPSIATVENGVLTKLAPGTVTVTATYGNLSASMDVTVESHNLRTAEILSYNPKTGQPLIAYDNIILPTSNGYVTSVGAKDNLREVHARGKGIFRGYIMQQFNSVTGEPVGHTHAFQEVCSENCLNCDFTRTCNHTKGTSYARDRSGHWYLCAVCGGGKINYAAHTISSEDAELCTACGSLNIPGDINEDVNLNDADAMYLLRYTLFPSRYPVERDPDVNKDNEVNDADAMYLLRHTLFPTRYPLYPA